MEPIGNSEYGGSVRRLMVARLNRVPNNAVFENEGNKMQKISVSISTAQSAPFCRESADYTEIREEKDPFFDAFALNPVGDDQMGNVENSMQKMVEEAVSNGVPEDKKGVLSNILSKRIDTLRTFFIIECARKSRPIQIDLVVKAKPVCVSLRNYLQDQRKFLFHFVSQLVAAAMAYSNPSAKGTCAPLLVPKPGPSKYRFTVDLRPINRYTTKHQFPIPNLEQELTKTSQ